MGDFNELVARHLPNVRVPQSTDRIYKDECCLSFDTPTSKHGLFVCLKTFLGFGKEYVDLYNRCTGNAVFLNIKDITSTACTPAKMRATEPEPTRLAIGVKGGFQGEKDVPKVYNTSIVILPEYIQISTDEIEIIPAVLLRVVNAIMHAESATKKEEILEWDGEIKNVSKHAGSLIQLDNGVKLPPTGWKCSRCDLTNNLWANLSDGTILCGRKYFDGSGGNGHALDHFYETKFPLAVKLGTINASGADVFSYDEDEMVEDPYLERHLSHFGINMKSMQKSDKTMTELEIDLNKKIGNEWELIQESGAKLNALFGPCLTGMKNLGNSCYLNSTMQVLLSIPEVRMSYLQKLDEIFTKNISNPINDFNVQLTKLANGLSSGKYSNKPSNGDSDTYENSGVTPLAFKRLVGKGHFEFSSSRQQDAQEFILHLFQLMEKNSRSMGIHCENNFKYNVEERIECTESKMVKYTTKSDYLLPLPVPYEMATNLAEVHEYEKLKNTNTGNNLQVVRAKVPFSACLKTLMEDEIIQDFWSPALKEKSTAKKRMRFSSFPNYLIVHVQKFTVGQDWVPQKLDVSVDFPDTLDLNQYKGTGLQAHEKELPDVDTSLQGMQEGDVGAAPQYNIDQAVVAQLLETGFPMEACKKAVHFTGNCGAEVAMTWLMEHISDPDFSDPLPAIQPQQAGGAEAGPSEDMINMIMGMGFTKTQALKALKATDNNLERAADWIFSHIDEIDSIPLAEGDTTSAPPVVAPPVIDGDGKYELYAFISHMGTSTACGHYVCHIKKDGQWVIFNDEKVAQSVSPPKDLGYIYFYKRSSL